MYEIFEMLLAKRGITAYKFCKDTNTSQSTIYTWKNKKTKASAKLAETVCCYFGVSLDYLMTGKENDDKNISLNDDFSFLNDAPYKDEILAIAKYLREFEDKNDLEFVKTFVEKMGNK